MVWGIRTACDRSIGLHVVLRQVVVTSLPRSCPTHPIPQYLSSRNLTPRVLEYPDAGSALLRFSAASSYSWQFIARYS